MDSDLSEALVAFKTALKALELPDTFGRADPAVLSNLQERFALPRRYLVFLAEADPRHVQTQTPAEQIQLHPAHELIAEQRGYCLDDEGKLIKQPTRTGWRPTWWVIGNSCQLGDPYFLDTSKTDVEGDCPVFTAMSGADIWQPRLCASGFASFLAVLAATMEVAADFDLDDYDPDNEQVFRSAVRDAVREVDPAAHKSGHWT